MVISDESMDFNDPKEFDDPQLFGDQLEVWTLIIQKSTVIPPSLMVLFFTIRCTMLRGSADGPSDLLVWHTIEFGSKWTNSIY